MFEHKFERVPNICQTPNFSVAPNWERWSKKDGYDLLIASACSIVVVPVALKAATAPAIAIR